MKEVFELQLKYNRDQPGAEDTKTIETFISNIFKQYVDLLQLLESLESHASSKWHRESYS